MVRICSVSGIFQTNCKLFVCAKEKTRNKKRYFTWLTPEPCRKKQRKQSFEF